MLPPWASNRVGASWAGPSGGGSAGDGLAGLAWRGRASRGRAGPGRVGRTGRGPAGSAGPGRPPPGLCQTVVPAGSFSTAAGREEKVVPPRTSSGSGAATSTMKALTMSMSRVPMLAATRPAAA